jgi:hypothetical protein
VPDIVEFGSNVFRKMGICLVLTLRITQWKKGGLVDAATVEELKVKTDMKSK